MAINARFERMKGLKEEGEIEIENLQVLSIYAIKHFDDNYNLVYSEHNLLHFNFRFFVYTVWACLKGMTL